jgi:methionyl-tRNA formyltransferase
MRIAFMGTPPFAAHILKVLLDAKMPIVAVYTQPPRPTGRGHRVTPSSVQTLAEAWGLPVFSPESLKTQDAQEQWRGLELDLAIVAAYGLLLPKPILDAPRLGCVNVHPSLLPRWRGATPLQSPILAGDKETGVTLMKMDEGLDTGDILWIEKMPLDPTMTTPVLTDILADKSAKALVKAIPAYANGELTPLPQSKEGITYADKLTKADGKLDWSLPAEVLERKVRALTPWPGTWFQVGEDVIKVLEARVSPGSGIPGMLLGENFTVACGEGALQILQVQKVGKSPLCATEFLRGYKLPACLSHEAL